MAGLRGGGRGSNKLISRLEVHYTKMGQMLLFTSSEIDVMVFVFTSLDTDICYWEINRTISPVSCSPIGRMRSS